ncbi:MAG: hypothetical protein IJJ45_01735 [Clostridia bacterium]|nr:hypothetical protein [Clostridia bacterium]
MPNSIALFRNYVPMLDEVYKLAALSSVLDGAPELVRAGANANELVIPKMTMSGLADYSRNGGYSAGDVTITNETVACNYDRGRMFQVDNLDNAETAGIAFGRLAGEFIRTKVAPEIDAFRFATYAGASGIGSAAASLSAGADVVAALRTAHAAMDEAEVPADGRILFITSALKGMVDDLDTTKSRAAMNLASQIVVVPQTRFYTGVTLGTDGYARKDPKQEFTATTSQTDFVVTAKPAAITKVTVNGTAAASSAYTYTAATGTVAFGTAPGNGKTVVVYYDTGASINFLLVHKPAVIQFQKHIAPKVITPEQNQDADAYKFGYRVVGIADVYENKVAGIYCHSAPAV